MPTANAATYALPAPTVPTMMPATRPAAVMTAAPPASVGYSLSGIAGGSIAAPFGAPTLAPSSYMPTVAATPPSAYTSGVQIGGAVVSPQPPVYTNRSLVR